MNVHEHEMKRIPNKSGFDLARVINLWKKFQFNIKHCVKTKINKKCMYTCTLYVFVVVYLGILWVSKFSKWDAHKTHE